MQMPAKIMPIQYYNRFCSVCCMFRTSDIFIVSI